DGQRISDLKLGLPKDPFSEIWDLRSEIDCLLFLSRISRARFEALMIEKILSLEQMHRERERLRSTGKRLVFTNGVFDLIHVGHVRYLTEARSLGDRLLVAINSDSSVRQLKGEARPIFNELERAEILA